VSARILAVVLGGAFAASGALAACTMDFGQFEPVDASTPDGKPADAAGNDARPANDGPADAGGDSAAPDAPGCTPSDTCLSQAKSCGDNCSQALDQCLGNCGSGGCRQNCHNQAQSCSGTCAAMCLTCTQMAGCPDNPDCLDASQIQ
jgi:hypothetical protein